MLALQLPNHTEASEAAAQAIRTVYDNLREKFDFLETDGDSSVYMEPDGDEFRLRLFPASDCVLMSVYGMTLRADFGDSALETRVGIAMEAFALAEMIRGQQRTAATFVMQAYLGGTKPDELAQELSHLEPSWHTPTRGGRPDGPAWDESNQDSQVE
jgi:hypothetical protein